MVEEHVQQPKSQVKEIADVIEEFKDVFGKSVELPPRRTFNHQILLKEGTAQVSGKPYRYPHY